MRKLARSPFFVVLIMVLSAGLVSPLNAQIQTISPPPTPHFILTSPTTNLINYVINVTNQGSESAGGVTLDFALPDTSAPDSYVEVENVQVAGEHVSFQQSYNDRGNTRLQIYADALRPYEQLSVNVTFSSLKYKVEYPRPLLSGAGYPVEYYAYTQPEMYIESNDPLVISKAQALMGARVDTYRIAQRMYDFVISYLSYSKQSETRGAFWALQNGKGDCTEFGMLFVALLRAVGIPARTVSGFVTTGSSVPPPPPLGALAGPAHLWAEFYVEGVGWVPVDPTFGRSTPEDHFGILWPRYLPFLRGPTMESPKHSLISLRYTGSILNYTVELYVTPVDLSPFADQTIVNLYQADILADSMRQVADRAYGYGFDISSSYTTIESAYDSLFSATNSINMGDASTANTYLAAATQAAQSALDSITRQVQSAARLAIDKAWSEGRFLGAMGGESYLQRSGSSNSAGDYINAVRYSLYAKREADRAPSIAFWIGPLALCVFVVWAVGRSNGKRIRL